MKKLKFDLKKELLEKIDELKVLIDDEFLDIDYNEFKKLKNELENVQDELISTF